jgi:UDP:flavonoid glycosyltransferase YjiC (YdhE family)
MPFFYDQPYNASIIEHLNVGIWVKPQEFVTKFPNALKEILHNE